MITSVISREIRDYMTYTLIWTIALLASEVANTLSSVVPAPGSEAAYDVVTVLAGAYNNLVYTGPIFAMILGALVISQEEDEKTIEFLLAHPLTRGEIAASKLLAYTVAVVFLNVVLLSAGLILIAALGPVGSRGIASFLSVCLSTFVLMYAFGAAGVLLSMFVVKGGPLVGYSIGIPLLLFLLMFLQNAGDPLRMLSYLSPFRYLNVMKILETGGVDLPFVLVAAIVSAGFLMVSVAIYRKREFAV